MSKDRIEYLKPFISVLVIILTLLSIVFIKMEVRRMGYTIWKQAKVEKREREKYRQLSVDLIEKVGLERINEFAKTELDMQRAQRGQIIHMSHQQVALRQ